MHELDANTPGPAPATLYCPRCGKAMLVSRDHIQTEVACPHCRQHLDPWRMGVGVLGETASPHQNRGVTQADWVGYSWRNRWVAGALGLLLGGLGVHRFYLGFTGIGFAQIAASVLTLGIVGPIWGFIEGILCFAGAMRDADGLPLRG